MNALNKRISEAINERKYLPVETLADMFFDSHKKGLTGHGINTEKVKKFITCDLSALTESINDGSPRLFANYISWLIGILDKKGRSADEITDNLHNMRNVLSSLLFEEARPVIEQYIDKGLSVVRASKEKYLNCTDSDDPARAVACRFLDMTRNFKGNEAVSLIVGTADKGMRISDIYSEILKPALYEAGRLWQSSKANSVIGHYTAEITIRIMNILTPRTARYRKQSITAASACVSEELHDIGLRMVTAAFEAAGVETVFLGSSIPSGAVYEYLARYNPDYLLLSAALPVRLKKVESVISKIKADNSIKTKIIAGGYAFNMMPDEWRNLGADGFAFDPAGAVKLCGIKDTE